MTKRKTLAALLHGAEEELRRKGFSTARLDAEILLAHQLGMDRTGLYIHFHDVPEEREAEGFQSLVERRLKEEPVAYILGRKEFWSLRIEVGPGVLIPRPDTEILVEEVLGAVGKLGKEDPDILEIGTGSGAVAIALAKELVRARIVATDVSGAALRQAEKNATAHEVADRIQFVQGDLFEPIGEKFDIIASNPPYISEEIYENLPKGVRLFEPREALLAGPLGTEYHEALVRGSGIHLRKSGWILMEIGEGQRPEIEEMLRASGMYEEIVIRSDYAGLPRVVGARRKNT